MKLQAQTLIILLAVLGTAFPGTVQATDVPIGESPLEAAICNVCRVHDGETEAEPVVATSDFQGETYGFCSQDCKARFAETPEAYLPPVFPRPAPSFVVNGLDAEPVSSEALEGKVTLIDFWATWCLPCVADLPELTELHRRYADQGFQVLGISIDEGDSASKKVARMVKKKKVAHPIFLDQGEEPAWAAYQVRSVPAQFLVDREGRIVAQWSGKIDLNIVGAAVAEALKTSDGGS